MTERHSQIADFVRVFTGDNGFSPSYQQIADYLGITSVSTVHKHIHSMEELGIIRLRGKRRAVEVIYASKPDCANCELLRHDLKEALATIDRMRARRPEHG